jgi:hypothetical protein
MDQPRFVLPLKGMPFLPTDELYSANGEVTRMRMEERAVAIGLLQCDTDGMQPKKPASRNPDLRLQEMVRWEGRTGCFANAIVRTAVIGGIGGIIFGVGTQSASSIVCACMLVAMVCLVAIPFGFKRERYDSQRTSELIHLSLDNIGDADELLKQIDSELAATDKVEIFGAIPTRFRRQTQGTLFLTENWILWFGWSEFRFLPISSVLWFYKRIEIPSAWWQTSDRKRVELACVSFANDLLTLRMHCEEFVEDAMQILIRKQPQALFGFKPEFKEMADKHITALQHEVARRRVAWEPMPQEERAEWRNDCLADARHFVRRVDSTTGEGKVEY